MTPIEMMLRSARSVADNLLDALRRRNEQVASQRTAALGAEAEPQGLLALFDDESPLAPAAPDPLRPDEACAAVLLGRALDHDRTAAAGLLDDAAVTVIDVPSPDLVEPVADLVKYQLFGPGHLHDGDALRSDGPPWKSATIFSRDGKNEKRNRSTGNQAVAQAVQRRSAVIGISADPFRLLPSDLVAFATQRIRLPRINPESIAAVIEAVTGKRPPRPVPAAVARLSLLHLQIGIRADLGADRSLARLEKAAATARGVAEATPVLSELHGLGEARDWGLSLIEDLRDLREGRITAADLPRGILLGGKPGTGKTLFARALGREAGIYFRATSYGEWQSFREGHLGNVIQAIRNVFAEAAANAPSILFIDEIDSLPARGSTQHRDDWWVAITNVLLEELDSVDPKRRQGVVVVAACNNPERLDPALTRAGRLDRIVRIPLPDASALAAIMRAHLGEHLRVEDLMPAAAEARGSTGADVQRWARAARRRARLDNRPIAIDDIVAEIRNGRPPLTKAQRWRMAYHESGHALVAFELDSDCPVGLSIVDPAGGTASFDFSRLALLTRPMIENLLVRILAGRVAEELAFGAISDGGVSDIALATKLAVSIECTLGLGSLGPLSLGDEPRIAEVLAIPEAAASVKKMLVDAHARALAILKDKRSTLDRLTAALFDRGFLEQSEIGRILAPSAPAADTSTAGPPDPYSDLPPVPP